MLSIVILILLIQLFNPTYQFKTIQASLASSVELSCSNFEPINPAKILWIRDDQASIISLDSVITVRDERLSILAVNNMNMQERTLRINNIEEQDHGLYRCMQGDIVLNEILLDVLIPPRIISYAPEHMRITVREGRDARFSCIATGNPAPTILWHINGLSRPGIITMIDGKNESMLILRNISRYDSGRVDCSATNTLSTVNRQFLLHVKYKPIVTVPFHMLHFRLYDFAKITCHVCSIPLPTIFDFFRPKQTVPIMRGIKEKYDEILNETCTKLTIKIYLNETSLFGPYVCRARNSLGVNHAEFVLKELIPPTKRIKYITEYQPSSSSTYSMMIMNTSIFVNENASFKRNIQSNSVTTQVIIHQINQACKITTTTSVLFFLTLFIILI